MDLKFSRRAALAGLFGTTATACKPRGAVVLRSDEREQAQGTFAHGIASGDPLSDRVILWTRITPSDPEVSSGRVYWEVSKDKDFETIAQKGYGPTNKAKDFTFKVDVDKLEPDNWYYYRFKFGDSYSATGRTRTLPVGKTDKVRFAVVSCANYQQGYFNVYDHIARDGKFDALLHLGDYLYEYGPEGADAAMKDVGRTHEPAHEIVELSDYRIRHAQYRSDQALQALTAQMPMIAIWDDHESTNDSWKDGAQNHQPDTEGGWNARKSRAMRAYYDWMPVRNPEPGKGRDFLYRSFEWGDLVTLAAIETRLLARSETFEFEDYFDELFEEESFERLKNEKWLDPSREMMGSEQVEWLAKTFGQSKRDGKTWRLLANQVLIGRMFTPDMTPHINVEELDKDAPYYELVRQKILMSPLGLPLYPDSWDGYPAARERFYEALTKEGVEDLLVVTGDAHEYFANDLTNEANVKKGVEICTSSVSSTTRGDALGEGAAQMALLVTRENDDVRYYNPMTKGYVDLTLSRKSARARMIAIDTVFSPEYTAQRDAEFKIKKSGNSLELSSAEGLSPVQLALFKGIA